MFLNVCCCHIPFVYMLVKFVLYLWKQNLKVTPVNYGRYLIPHKVQNLKQKLPSAIILTALSYVFTNSDVLSLVTNKLST